MKIKNLIELLQTFDQDAECILKSTEGYNPVAEVKITKVLPNSFTGSTYYQCDYLPDLFGYDAIEIIAKSKK